MAKRRNPNAIPVLTKKLDAQFSRYIRLKDADPDGFVKCVTCSHRGHWKQMQAGHWIPRQHMAVRWEEWNVHPQCYACNMHYGGRPQEYRDWMVEKYGEEKTEILASRRREIRKWNRDELKVLIERYSRLVRGLLDKFEGIDYE